MIFLKALLYSCLSFGATGTLNFGGGDSLPTQTGNSGKYLSTNGTTAAWSTVSGGVSSVDMSVPSFLSVAGNPIVSSGTFAITLANQNANRIFAGPSSGGAAAPSFRALVATDIPDLSVTYSSAAAFTPWTSYTPTFTAWGSESNVTARWRRMGGSLEVLITATAGTATGSEARVSFPGAAAGNPVSASWLPTVQICGEMVRATAAALNFVALCEAGKSYFTFGVQGSGTGGLTKAVGTGFIANSQAHSFFASVPIEGW